MVEAAPEAAGLETTLKRAAVLGHPVSHSLSPVLHNAAYQALGLDGWKYTAIDVTPDQLPALLDETLLESDEWAGFSVTMPLKTYVVPWLETAAARGLATIHVDPLVTATGSANTIVMRAGPAIFASTHPPVVEAVAKQPGLETTIAACNTDVAGVVAALREVIRHGPVERFAIIGSGATACSVLAAAQLLGANEVTVFAREAPDQATLRAVAGRLGIAVVERDLADAAAELHEFDAVVSTLPAHAADQIAADLIAREEAVGTAAKIAGQARNDELLGALNHALGALLDVVYDPRPTELMAAWSALGGAALGGAVLGGERMLLHQAAAQVELMTGLPAPLAAMDAALHSSL